MIQPRLGDTTVSILYMERPRLRGALQARLVIKGDPDYRPDRVFWVGSFKIGVKMVPHKYCTRCGSRRIARSYGYGVRKLQCMECGCLQKVQAPIDGKRR
jgi:hypothetical protein